ncbi:hypothetical protein MMC09_006830 [Bachmanniomyces sp. S44760]|nr:hypothetical protein [Bachmanniomyces sp. S44760]
MCVGHWRDDGGEAKSKAKSEVEVETEVDTELRFAEWREEQVLDVVKASAAAAALAQKARKRRMENSKF